MKLPNNFMGINHKLRITLDDVNDLILMKKTVNFKTFSSKTSKKGIGLIIKSYFDPISTVHE